MPMRETDDAREVARRRRPRYTLNRYPITCVDCGREAPAGAARIWRKRGKYVGACRVKTICESDAPDPYGAFDEPTEPAIVVESPAGVATVTPDQDDRPIVPDGAIPLLGPGGVYDPDDQHQAEPEQHQGDANQGEQERRAVETTAEILGGF